MDEDVLGGADAQQLHVGFASPAKQSMVKIHGPSSTRSVFDVYSGMLHHFVYNCYFCVFFFTCELRRLAPFSFHWWFRAPLCFFLHNRNMLDMLVKLILI